MRATLSFWISTSSTAAEWPLSNTSHRLEVLGWERASRRIYLVEHTGERTALFVMATSGEHAGAALPLAGDAARIARLRRELVPMATAPARGWDLTTRVVQRRGLRLASMTTPIRKFALARIIRERSGLAGDRGGNPESAQAVTRVTSHVRTTRADDRLYSTDRASVPGPPR